MSDQTLEKLYIDGCSRQVDETTGTRVFHVTTPHALTQASGYLKYVRGIQQEAVFFRGQRRLYKGLAPALFRGVSNPKTQSDRIGAINTCCRLIAKANPIFDKVPPAAHEPLMQHYGLNTSWIDLVDNVWVALWFACHRALVSGTHDRFLHFERRNPADESVPFAFILLVAADTVPSDPFIPGLWRGSRTELVDLRVAAPSLFLRPHAQHGVLFRMRAKGDMRPLDYNAQTADIIRIDLRNALAWLGDGDMLNTHAIFPPPFYDHGYGFLLDTPVQANEIVGCIQHVGT
ncbi:FRG domain-containing protein [Pelagibius sp. 7325]|uniref:FRG domain-containing protein n=1 Tax=Pelagibius sp. 7325 TaxID=3131994 RepID=UPI0030ED9FC8